MRAPSDSAKSYYLIEGIDSVCVLSSPSLYISETATNSTAIELLKIMPAPSRKKEENRICHLSLNKTKMDYNTYE